MSQVALSFATIKNLPIRGRKEREPEAIIVKSPRLSPVVSRRREETVKKRRNFEGSRRDRQKSDIVGPRLFFRLVANKRKPPLSQLTFHEPTNDRSRRVNPSLFRVLQLDGIRLRGNQKGERRSSEENKGEGTRLVNLIFSRVLLTVVSLQQVILRHFSASERVTFETEPLSTRGRRLAA